MPLLRPLLNVPYTSAVKGDGIYVYDEAGARYIDGSSGAVAVNIGHAVPEIVAAMSRQAATLEYVSRVQFTNPPAEDLANLIADRWAPPGIDWVWYSTSGSDAVESAFRIARQYHVDRGEASRYKVISTWHSYHGSTLGAIAASGREGPRHILQPYFSGAWPHIRAPYCYRCPYGSGLGGCCDGVADELESVILHEGPETISAFVIEPVVGTTTGGTHGDGTYWARVRAICDKYGVLLIADEVISGFGRTGAKFAVDHWGVQPDIIATGKGLGSGYVPLFATLVKSDVVAVLQANSGAIALGNSYNASPLTCAVGIAVLKFIETNDLVHRAHVAGERLSAGLLSQSGVPVVGDIRGMGLMLGVEFVRNQEEKRPFSRHIGFAGRVASAARRNGLLLIHRTGTVDGVAGDHVFISPPLSITDDQVDELLRIFWSSVDEVLQQVEVQTDLALAASASAGAGIAPR